MAISEYLAHYRIRANLTQQELADKCGISQQLINGIEHGTRTATEPVIIRLSEIFNCTVDELLHGPKSVTGRRS